MISRFKSRNAQTPLDMLMVIVFLFVFVIVVVFGYMIYSQLNDEIQADIDMSVEAQTAASTVGSQYPTFMDNAFLVFLILFWVLLLVSSFMIDTHPVFFIVTIFLLFFTFIVGMVLNNTYQDIMSDSSLSTYAASFPVINFVFSNLLMVVIVMGFSAAVALYARNKL